MRGFVRMASGSALLLLALPALAGDLRPWPGGTPVGSSMAGQRITPDLPRPGFGAAGRIANIPIFGDEPEERRSGRRFDDRYVRPVVPRRENGGRAAIELRATQGRADLNPVNAGAFARSGPFAAGASGATRIGRGNGGDR